MIDWLLVVSNRGKRDREREKEKYDKQLTSNTSKAGDMVE